MQAEVYCPLLLFFASCVGAPTIKVHNLEKRNINSSCETGMISEMDRYVLFADVDLTYGSHRWLKTIVFEIKNPDSSQFVPFCFLNLENGCHDRHCYCEEKPTTKQTTYHIIINITAHVRNSEAEIRGVLTNVYKKVMYSNTVRLPAIYDLSMRILQANNLTISPNQSSYQLKQTDRRLEFCCLNTPSPCVTKVVANHSATTSGDRCTAIDVPPEEDYDNVTAVTNVCHNYKFTQVIGIQTENIASTPYQPNDTNVWKKPETMGFKLYIIIAAVITLIIVIYLRIFRVHNSFSRITGEKQSQYIAENENKRTLNCLESSDSGKSFMKAVLVCIQPGKDNSDELNTHTTLLNGTASTTTA